MYLSSCKNAIKALAEFSLTLADRYFSGVVLVAERGWRIAPLHSCTPLPRSWLPKGRFQDDKSRVSPKDKHARCGSWGGQRTHTPEITFPPQPMGNTVI